MTLLGVFEYEACNESLVTEGFDTNERLSVFPPPRRCPAVISIYIYHVGQTFWERAYNWLSALHTRAKMNEEGSQMA